MNAIVAWLNSAGVLAVYVCVVGAYQEEVMWAELDIDLCIWSGICNKRRLLGWKWFLSGSPRHAECNPMIQHKFSASSMEHLYKLQKRNVWFKSRVITCQMCVGGTTGWSHKMAYYFWCESLKHITWTEMKWEFFFLKSQVSRCTIWCIWYTLCCKLCWGLSSIQYIIPYVFWCCAFIIHLQQL